MGDILLLLILLAITYTTGCIIEKNHYNKIKKREIALFRQPHVNFGAKNWKTNKKIKKIELVTGEGLQHLNLFLIEVDEKQF